MSICPHCGNHCPTPRHSEKLRSLFAARVGLAAKVNRRNADAAHNEMATAIRAADEAVMRSLCVPADVLTSDNRGVTAAEHAIRAGITYAEDVIDPRSAITPEGFVKLDLERVRAQGWGEFWDAVGRAIDKKYEPRAVGFIEFKPGEEPEMFDEATGPMGGGL